MLGLCLQPSRGRCTTSATSRCDTNTHYFDTDGVAVACAGVRQHACLVVREHESCWGSASSRHGDRDNAQLCCNKCGRDVACRSHAMRTHGAHGVRHTQTRQCIDQQRLRLRPKYRPYYACRQIMPHGPVVCWSEQGPGSRRRGRWARRRLQRFSLLMSWAWGSASSRSTVLFHYMGARRPLCERRMLANRQVSGWSGSGKRLERPCHTCVGGVICGAAVGWADSFSRLLGSLNMRP